MPAPVFTRASRDFQFVPGQGSSLVVRQYDNVGNISPPLAQDGVIFDIDQGFIRQTFRNQKTTHSGSNGADLYTRVGSGWNFALVLSFPAALDLVTVDQVIPGVDLAAAFAEELLGSARSVHLQFNVGDPLFWTSRTVPLQTRSLRAAKALLETVEYRMDGTLTEVIGLNIAGIGNSLLWTYLDDVKQQPQVWR